MNVLEWVGSSRISSKSDRILLEISRNVTYRVGRIGLNFSGSMRIGHNPFRGKKDWLYYLPELARMV